MKPLSLLSGQRFSFSSNGVVATFVNNNTFGSDTMYQLDRLKGYEYYFENDVDLQEIMWRNENKLKTVLLLSHIHPSPLTFRGMNLP